MAIRAIFFDAAGTLIKPVRRVGESYALIARTYGIDASAAEIAKRFGQCFESAPPLAFPGANMGEIPTLEREWWKRLVERIFEPRGRFENFDDYFSELFAYFARPESWSLYPEALETLSALKERGFILDVISNFDSRLIHILDGLGVARYFQNIFISSHVGHAKPAREIFETALNRHGLAAESALHVGDGPESDLRGALNAGLRAILVDREGGQPDCSLRVSKLKDIISFLDDGQVLASNLDTFHRLR
jgi:putative hydrolase of the HAD superfamily